LFVLVYHQEALCVTFGNSPIFLFLPAELERCANRSLHWAWTLCKSLSTQVEPATYVIWTKQIALLQESLRICLIVPAMESNVCRVTNGAHVLNALYILS